MTKSAKPDLHSQLAVKRADLCSLYRICKMENKSSESHAKCWLHLMECYAKTTPEKICVCPYLSGISNELVVD